MQRFSLDRLTGRRWPVNSRSRPADLSRYGARNQTGGLDRGRWRCEPRAAQWESASHDVFKVLLPFARHNQHIHRPRKTLS
jgi:hypothetical protein